MVKGCICAVFSMLILSSAHAVTLGEIKTTSYLNEPLNFSIPLQIGKTELIPVDSFRVSLASSDEYARQGLVYPWGVGAIRLSVAKGRNGRIYINGRSTKPVKDLIVYILVDVSWPSGHIQKEYSTLVDLRGVSDEPAILKRKTSAVIVKPAQNNTFARVQRVKTNQAPTRVERRQPPRDPVRTSGFQSTKDYVDYTVKRGDALSLIAQRLRGSVELPLHHYIQAITRANSDTFKNGLGNLEVGQVIRIPNPSLVAQKKHSNDRRLERSEAGTPSQYRVKYGDSLFLIAKAFKPVNASVDSYISALKQANANQLGRSNFLEPGVVLTIPNPNDAAIKVAQAENSNTEPKTDSQSQEPPQAVATPLNDAKAVVDASKDAPDQAVSNVKPISELQTLGADKPVSGVMESGAVEPLSTDGESETSTDAQPMDQQVVAAIENNLALEKEIELLKNNISNLESNVTNLKRDNQNLTANIVNFNEQQQKAPKNTNFLLWGLLVLLALLAGLCGFLFNRMRKLADAVANMALGASTHSGVSVNNPSYAPESELARESQSGGVFKRESKGDVSSQEQTGRDYSDYDFSKSNYDYSELYDVDKLKEEIKASGSEAFVKPTDTGIIEIADAEEDLGTVQDFIESGHYQAAGRLLEELIAKSPDNLDNRLLHLDLEVRCGTDESTDALAIELLKLFPDETSQSRIKDQLTSSRLAATSGSSDESLDNTVEVTQQTSGTLMDLTVDSDVYDIEELSSETLDAALLSQQVSFADEDSQSKSDALYEVKVYMSYGHDDMARTSLDEYLARFPEDTNALILKLELLAREQSVDAVNALADKLRADHDLLDDHESRISEIFKKMKEGDFTDSLGDALKSTALMDDGKTTFDRTEFIEDQATSFLEDDKTTMISDDELGDLEEDEFLAHVRAHADNNNPKE